MAEIPALLPVRAAGLWLRAAAPLSRTPRSPSEWRGYHGDQGALAESRRPAAGDLVGRRFLCISVKEKKLLCRGGQKQICCKVRFTWEIQHWDKMMLHYKLNVWPSSPILCFITRKKKGEGESEKERKREREDLINSPQVWRCRMEEACSTAMMCC